MLRAFIVILFAGISWLPTRGYAQVRRIIVTPKGQGLEATSDGARFWNNVNVTVTRGTIDVDTVMQALMSRNVTGEAGLCIGCTSSTPESEQNNGRGVIYAEQVTPFDPVPFFKGTAMARQTSAYTVEAQMVNSLMELRTTITLQQVADDFVAVSERGFTVGTGAETFSRGHLRYFDLAEALRRALE